MLQFALLQMNGRIVVWVEVFSTVVYDLECLVSS